MSQFCTCRSGSNEPEAQRVMEMMTKTTTPEKFDAYRQACPKYQLHFGARCGWNALGWASHLGNLPLVKHIVDVGGLALINLGNTFGWTPLFCAVETNQLEVAEVLYWRGGFLEFSFN